MNPIMISLNMDKIEALDSANLKPDSFTLDQSARVTIKVYNVAGQLVEWMAQQQTRPRQTGRSLVGSR
jgi:hypothetical protein